jgi:hypothetical protein
MDSCENCNFTIANIYGPLKTRGDKWYIKRKKSSGKTETIAFFGLPDIFKIKVCPNCGSRKLTPLDHATFMTYQELERGLEESKDFLESTGQKFFFANYADIDETL